MKSLVAFFLFNFAGSYSVVFPTQCCRSRMHFFGSGSGSYFSVAVSDPTRIFSNILNIHFTFVFSSSKCVRFHIMTRYKLFMGIFLIKKKYTDARIRNDFFRICIRIQNLLKVSDPTGSGSTTLMPRSAGFCFFYSTKSVFLLPYSLCSSV
jgi:hypothetical protein